MNVTNIKKEPLRVASVDQLTLEIQNYGLDNLYPQTVKQIASASGTCMSCLETYSNFIEGKGFADVTFYKAIINNKGLTVDSLLRLHSKDFSDLKGVAMHVNYNLLAEITDVTFIPFENCRLGLEDDQRYVSKIALHDDWQRLKRRTKMKGISKQTIDYIDIFNPKKEVVLAQIAFAGGIDKYKGQVYWFSGEGEGVYPKPIYDSVITDVSTESGLSNVNYREVRYNFLTAGMLIRKKPKDNSESVPDENSRESLEPDGFTENFKQFQGDEKACKIIDVVCEFEEEAPVFVPFKTQKIGLEFKETGAFIQSNIGKRFRQPQILRADDVSKGFGADVMNDAYNFYNSITDVERRLFERIYTEVFSHFATPINPTNDYSIIPLKYIMEVDMTIKPKKPANEPITEPTS